MFVNNIQKRFFVGKMKVRTPNVNSISRTRKTFTRVCLVLCTISGTLFGGVGIAKIVNYTSPWYFGSLLAVLGGLTGWGLAKLFQNQILINRQLQREYGNIIFLMVMGFAGLFILFGAIFNSRLSHVKHCNAYVLEAKGETLGRNKSPIHGNLGFMINGEQTIIGCSMNYHNQVTISQNITVCYYKGGLGFNFYLIPNDTTWGNR